MPPVDDKVVAMSFENGKFEAGVNKTVSSLDRLKAALHFPSAGKSFDNINASAKKVDFGHIGKGIDSIQSKLGYLSVAALAVFANIALGAVRAGATLVKSLTIGPISAGFKEYSTNLNAIQTILANTQAAGTGLKDVNKALLELNQYSDKTIYNFSQMAKNIGTFTAAGVDLKTATSAIKGIANLAALSGSNAEQASTAMYQLSQAISAGSLKLMDWNSVVNAGMGGTVFQRALAQTAEKMGTLEKGAVKLKGPMKNVTIAGEAFRQSLSTPGKASWLTSDVLTSTLKQFTGDLTDAELAAQGFTAAEIIDIQKMAKTAMHAATEVKTIAQVFDVAKETAGSGWAQTFQIVMGDFVEAKKTFTALSGAVNGFLNRQAEARNKVLGDWKALGGRTLLIESLKGAFKNLGMVLKPIGQAFRDIFPAKTGKDLYNLTVQFSQFVKTIKPSPETIENLKRTFRGFFAILSIGKQIIGGIFSVFGQLFGAIGEGSGSFLGFTATIGDFLVKVDLALKKGDRLKNFFKELGNILVVPIELLGEFKTILSGLFGGFSSGGVSGEISGITTSMTALQKIMSVIGRVWDKFINSIGLAGEIIKPVIETWFDFMKLIPELLGEAFKNMNFEAVLAVIRVGLLGGIFLMFKKFLGGGPFIEQLFQGFKGVSGGILGNISGAFGTLEGTMKSLQTNLKAKTLKEIAIAIALLTLSVVALSFVDADDLKKSLTAMAFGFGQLLGAMVILEKVGTTMGTIRMPFIAASLIMLAVAINILTIAVIALSFLSWEQLAKGLGAVAFLLVAITLAAKPLGANSAGMIRASIGITVIAIALNLLALAVRQFASMSLAELGKGLGSVAVGLGIIVAAMTKMPTKGLIVAGTSLIIIATALNLLALAVRQFGSMDLLTLGKGLGGVAASLIIIAIAMKRMPSGKSMIVQAAGLLLVSLALQGIARAIKIMGGMSIEQIAKGLGTLAGSLGILAAGMHLMKGAVSGAIALALVATGLALLVPVLVLLGKQSWEQILKSMIGLAAAIGLIAIAGKVLTGALPGLMGFGVAMLLIGGGLALAGAGVALVGVGLSAIALAGPAAIGILIQAFTDLTKAVIVNAKLLILGLLEIVRAFAASAPKFVDALVKILSSVIDAIIKLAPKITELINSLIDILLTVLEANQERIIAAGFDLLLDLLKGLRDNIGQIVILVADIIVNFLTALAKNLGKIVEAGAKILVAVLKGIASGNAAIVTAGISIITKFLNAIGDNLAKVAKAGISIITKLLSAIAKSLPEVIKAGTDLIVNFIDGIGNAGPRIIAAATNTIIKFMNALSKNSVKLADAGATAIINFLNGIADVIENRMPELMAAGVRIGEAIVKGMLKGIANLAEKAVNAASDLGKRVLKGLGKAVKFWSPSHETFIIGQSLVMGLANGISKDEKALMAANKMGMGIIQMFKDVFQITSPSQVMREIGAFVAQGFLRGLQGYTGDITEAITTLKTSLAEAMQNARSTIASERDKLKELRKAKKPDQKAISEAQKVIKKNQDILERSTAAHKVLVKTLKDEKKELFALAKEYEKVAGKLEKAKEVLAQAKQTRDDAMQGFADQYGELPEIVKEDAEGKPIDQLAAYTAALTNQIAAEQAYKETLQQLRALGLDDKTYEKLLKEGTVDQAFADQLLAGGQTAVDALNVLDSQLASVSTTLATEAANNLHQAGVDAAQGIVSGLESEMAGIKKVMNKIARAMVKAIKDALKIKSPSEEFAKVGKFSMEGMARGFSNSSKVVTKSIDVAAQDALTEMRKSMSNISDIVTDELDTDPTITPILDLTQVQSGIQKLAELTAVDPITAAASFGQASTISAEQIAHAAEAAAGGGKSFKFEQNNYSPEALTEVEIYRQTRNQLSQLRLALERN